MIVRILGFHLLFLWWSAAERIQIRPNLYFGARERKPIGATFGLGWFFPEDSSSSIRFECKEDDGLQRWGFVKADADYGKQVLHDGPLILTTEHVIVNDETMFLRVNGSSNSTLTATTTMVSLLFSLHSPSKVHVVGHSHTDASVSQKGLRGDSAEVKSEDGTSSMFIEWTTPDEDNTDDEDGKSTDYISGQVNDEDVCTEHTERIRPGRPTPELSRTHFTAWKDKDLSTAFKSVVESTKRILSRSEQKAKEVAYSLMANNNKNIRIAPVLNNKADQHATTAILQRTLSVPFSVTVRFSVNNKQQQQIEQEDSSKKKKRFAKLEKEFDEKFSEKFPLLQKSNHQEIIVDMAKAALANTIGSIGYFYGSNLLDDGTWTSPPGSLLTGVPSRSFFPRGFFWDEGFHQLLVSKFNPKLAQEVIESWLTRFDSSGWVAREQVLGLEAIERVPFQFLAQNRTFANPPTLLLAVESLLDVQQTSKEFAQHVFDVFMKHRDWLQRTQQSRAQEGLMAWKGRSKDAIHTLTSGIDDYPRGFGHDFYREAHVDLISWACWEDQMLHRLGRRIGASESTLKLLQDSFEKKQALILKHHWSPAIQFFSDIGFTQPTTLTLGHLPHVGYVGLIPFALKVIPVNQDTLSKLWSILKAIESPQQLRAKGIGIRSLSRSDPAFGQGENYWRGAVWININYLCVQALKYYSQKTQELDSKFAKTAWELAEEIRKDLIQNIFKQYKQDGFLFESYDSVTGRGRGTRPFTGWTALVVLLMNDE